MKKSFEPQKLNIALIEITRVHPLRSEPPQVKTDNEFISLLKEWAALPKEEIEQEALMIPSRRIRQLIEYSASNYLYLPMRNIIRIIRIRISEEQFKRLYALWQNAYESPDFRMLVYYILKDHPEYTQDVFTYGTVTAEMFMGWLRSNDLLTAVGKVLVQIMRAKRASIGNALQMINISTDSKLGKNCIDRFYTFCSREDYLQCEDKELKRVLARYGLSLIHAFLKNILTELRVEDFRRFFLSGQYLRDRYTGNYGSNNYSRFFTGYPGKLKLQYQRWLGYILVKESFSDGDPRLKFWSDYVPYSIGYIEHKKSECIELQFKCYHVIEFTVKTMGPLYIYDNETFRKKIAWHLDREENNDLRTYLFAGGNWESAGYEARIEHRGYWQERTKAYLTENQITQ